MVLDIELVAFYPEYSGKHETAGTVHIYVKDIGLDIRGIRYVKKKKSSFAFVPNKISWDFEDKKNIKYPIISFTDDLVYSTLLADIRMLMDDYFKTWEVPIGLPSTKKEFFNSMPKK